MKKIRYRKTLLKALREGRMEVVTGNANTGRYVYVRKPLGVIELIYIKDKRNEEI